MNILVQQNVMVRLLNEVIAFIGIRNLYNLFSVLIVV